MSRRGLFLALSLLLNVALIGFILGDLSRPIKVMGSLSEFGSHYPDEIRQSIRQTVIADRASLFDELRALRSTREALFTGMQAPEPDRAELERLMGEVRRHTTTIQARLQGISLDAVLAESPEVRALIEVPDGPGLRGGD